LGRLAGGACQFDTSRAGVAAKGQPRRQLRHHRRLPLLLLVPLLAATARRCTTLWGFALAPSQKGPDSKQCGDACRHNLLLRARSREHCSFTQRFAAPYSSSSSSSNDPFGPGGLYGNAQASGADAAAQQDAMKLFQQMLSGEVPPGAAAGQPGGFGGASGGPSAADPLAALLGGGLGGGLGNQKKATATDAFFTDRIPLVQKVKRPVLIAFFAYCFYRGWVGRFGLIQGCISNSYFAMLAVPVRVDPRSPFCGRPFFVSQLWVDYATKALGFLINWARGKTSIAATISEFKEKFDQMQSTAQQQPQDSPFGGPRSPWNVKPTETYAAAAPSMPTAPTTTVAAEPLHAGLPFQAVPLEEDPAPARPPTSRQPPPVVDADVRFLD